MCHRDFPYQDPPPLSKSGANHTFKYADMHSGLMTSSLSTCTGLFIEGSPHLRRLPVLPPEMWHAFLRMLRITWLGSPHLHPLDMYGYREQF